MSNKIVAKLEQTERQLEKALKLFAISSELHRTLNIDEVYNIILDTIKQIIGGKDCAIFVKNVENNKLELAAFTGKKSKESPIVSYPLKLESENIGEIRIDNLLPQKEALTEEDKELLVLLAEQAATAITGARLYTNYSKDIATLGKEIDKTLKAKKPLSDRKLTPEIIKIFNSNYLQLIKKYLKSSELEREDIKVFDFCNNLIKYDISPKEIIKIHLEAVSVIDGTSIYPLENRRIMIESRMVLLKVMTSYASLYREKYKLFLKKDKKYPKRRIGHDE